MAPPFKKAHEKRLHMYQVPANGADMAEVRHLKRVLKIDKDAELFRFLLHNYRNKRAEHIKTMEEIRQAYLAVKSSDIEPFIREQAAFGLKALAEYLLKKMTHADQS